MWGRKSKTSVSFQHRPTARPTEVTETARSTRRIDDETRDRILSLHASGMSQNGIARETGVAQSSVWRIVHAASDATADEPRRETEERDAQRAERKALRDRARKEEAMSRNEVTIDHVGEDRLYSNGHGRFLGTCRLQNGKVKKWHAPVGMSMSDARDSWRHWRDSVLFEYAVTTHADYADDEHETAASEAEEELEHEEKQVDDVEERGARKGAYVLSFNGTQASKPLYLFETFDDAARIADALSEPLKLSGVQGSYDVDEIKFWEK